MSFVKYRLKEVATDFGTTPKEIADIIGKFGERPKSNTQVLTDAELNCVFDYMTKNHQISSIEQVFATAAKKAEPKAAAPKAEAPKTEAPKQQNQNQARPQNQNRPQQGQNRPQQNQQNQNRPQQQTAAPQVQKAAEPERKRERRVVDTSAVQVNANRFADVDNLVSEKVQDYQGGKQRIGGKGAKQQKQQQNPKKGNKSRNEEQEKMRKLQMEVARKAPTVVKIPDEITVSELASRMKKTVAEVIKCLMKNGVMAAMNQTIDFDTAEFVATELGCKVEKEVTVTIEERIIDDHVDSAEELETRAPVVVVMGHVDHGKTSTLDAIRQPNVTSGEAGGITQHIGAYTVDVNGQMITFLDTPGHAAFTSMRARGAKSTDIAILVVAADDGIMPQTIESINHAKAAEVPIIVAINKMDKPTANPDKIKEQLTKYELIPEEWGGDTIIVPISAKTGMGLEELLEMVLLTAEVQELKANPNRRAKGVVIESKLDKGRGPLATVLVQNGTLRVGDVVICGATVGHVRAMNDDKGRAVTEAGPSVPVEIVGLDAVPEAGDVLNAVADERLARQLVDQRKSEEKAERFASYQKVTLENLFSQIEQGEVKELPIIVKADVNGSVEAVKQSLEKLSCDEVRVRVIHGGVGAVTESDIMLANASNAIIIGFNVRPEPLARDSAARDGVELRLYRVIYDAINDVQTAIKGMLAPKYRDVDLGRAEVRQVYHISSVGTVAGCYVTEGKITRNAHIRVVRDGIIIADDLLSSLKRFKDDVKEVVQGYECGMSLEKYSDVKEGDFFEAYMVEEYRD